ncbi:hypothetical protein fugu_006795 [Takifugu bimaculatus]|uniref:Tetraspanin-31 n=1 Tax=Takifugu bimaculatus TaxID=433685 RepID=A0A4Z2B3J8_9TELE|nr:hypothetical protein fugu_006795 [Takifugu bimaculatus]
MVCGGFTCSKNALCSLNVVYMLVGLLLIGIAAWGKGFGLVSSIHIIGGVIAVGVFLLLIAIVGLFGALHHHQVMLFFYMVILFIVFLFQFGISCSCLAMNRGQQETLLKSAWGMLVNNTKINLENQLDCCGLLNTTSSQIQFAQDVQSCTAACKKEGHCFTCGDKMLTHATEALKILGGVGLFFSFTEVSVWPRSWPGEGPLLAPGEEPLKGSLSFTVLCLCRSWGCGSPCATGTRRTPEQTPVRSYSPRPAALYLLLHTHTYTNTHTHTPHRCWSVEPHSHRGRAHVAPDQHT